MTTSPLAAAEPAADLAQPVGTVKLAEEHGHELPRPAVLNGIVVFDHGPIGCTGRVFLNPPAGS